MVNKEYFLPVFLLLVWVTVVGISSFIIAFRTHVQDAIIHIGEPGVNNCSVDIDISVWDAMNKLGIYRWVVACEDAAINSSKGTK